MYRNTESLCCVRGTKIVLKVNDTSKTDKLIGGKVRFVITRGTEQGEGELEEGSPRTQLPSYKISTKGVIYNMINILTAAVCYI